MPADLLSYLARELVDRPEAVRVERVDEDGDTILRLHVDPEDVGKVIGRKGLVARALRAVMRAGATRSRRRVLLEIVE